MVEKTGAVKGPVVVRELGEIGKYRVRLVRDRGRLVLDIREYVKGANFEGFTRKGIRLVSPKEMLALHGMVAETIAELEREGAKTA